MIEYAITSKTNLSMQGRSVERIAESVIIHYHSRIAFLLLVLIMAIIPGVVTGQTGTITGQVSDGLTGEPLAGAILSLQGTSYQEISDTDGRYLFRRIPAAGQTMVIRHIGYETLELPISLITGEQLEQDVTLSSEPVEGERMFVIARHHAQARALNSQKTSLNFKSAIPSEHFVRFGDNSVEHAMARIPGVQVSAYRKLNLRGVGPDRYNVLIDGQRMASTGLGDRSVDLGSLNSDMIHELEYIKVLTPDMDADALAGSVNIILFGPVGDDRQLGVHAGGQADRDYFAHTGPGSRASVRYTERVHENITFSAFGSHQIDNRGWQSLGIDIEVTDFGNGPEDVLERVAPGIHSDLRTRYGAGLQLKYHPTKTTSYYVQGLLNHDSRELIVHRNNWIAGRDWIDTFTTGAEGEQGNFIYEMNYRVTNIQQYMVQAGASHLGQFADLDYSAGWAHGRNQQRQYEFPFVRDRLDYSLDIQDRTMPFMQIINFRLLDDGTINRQLIFFDNLDYANDDHIENTLSARADINVPFSIGALKLGTSAKLAHKQGDYNESNYGYTRRSQFRFDQKRGTTVFDQDAYLIPWMVDAYNASQFFEVGRPQFTRDDDRFRRSAIQDYQSIESVLAGYGMATVALGPVSILAGARVEHDQNRYEGRRVIFNDLGQYEQTNDTSRTRNHTHLFPNGQLAFSLGSASKVRLSWSRSISRPDFNLLAPFELSHGLDSTLYRGNPELDPVLSDNLDLSFEHYYSRLGAFTLGAFYKELTGFIHEREQMLIHEPYVNWTERKLYNSDESAHIYGIEVSWQQNLDFLPGFLSNFGIFANYTWSHSVLDVDYRDDNVSLPHQSPHVANAALDYSQGRFFTQVSYHWSSASVNRIAQNSSLAPSVNTAEPVYMDWYEDGWTDLSASLGFRFSNHFRMWVDVYNILGAESQRYAHTRDLYPLSIHAHGMRGFNAGIRYTL